jgi:hypothetical protein
MTRGGPEMREDQRFPGVLIHESAYVDAGVDIGPDSRVWHFAHILGEVSIGPTLQHWPERHDRATGAGRCGLQDSKQCGAL